MKWLRGAVSEEEFEEVRRYVEQEEISVYRLVKEAVLEKVRNPAKKNPGPLDEFLEETP